MCAVECKGLYALFLSNPFLSRTFQQGPSSDENDLWNITLKRGWNIFYHMANHDQHNNTSILKISLFSMFQEISIHTF